MWTGSGGGGRNGASALFIKNHRLGGAARRECEFQRALHNFYDEPPRLFTATGKPQPPPLPSILLWSRDSDEGQPQPASPSTSPVTAVAPGPVLKQPEDVEAPQQQRSVREWLLPQLDDFIAQLYWSARAVQFKIFYKYEEDDANSLSELIRFEPAERPPPMAQLRTMTQHHFSDKWIKYFYAKFKNECPTGRMRIFEFKRLFGCYMPDRVSDAYLERMFNAFCSYSSNAPNDTLTFKDLIAGLARISEESVHSKADWTMRLMANNPCTVVTTAGGKSSPLGSVGAASQLKIHFAEFHEFVKSIFQLVGKERRRRADSIFASDLASQIRAQQKLTMLQVPSGTTTLLQVPSASMGPSRAIKKVSMALSIRSVSMQRAGSTCGSLQPLSASSVRIDRLTEAVAKKRALTMFKVLDARSNGYITLEDVEELFAKGRVEPPKEMIESTNEWIEG